MNKESAKKFLELSASGKVSEAYDKFVAPNMRHHNVHFKGDAESLKKAMEESTVNLPNKELVVKLAIEEGPLVSVFSHVKFNPDHPGIALVHIFRFENGKITEMWDLGQPVPDQSPNENGMF